MNSKTNTNCFSINLSKNQYLLYKKTFINLNQEWISLSKKKQKLYYKLYWNLLKSEILINTKIQKAYKKKWTFEENQSFSKLHIKLYSSNLGNKKHQSLDLLNTSFFYKKIQYNKSRTYHHRGYTIHGEKILDSKNNEFNILYTYKKLKDFYNI
jgi:hypothetical protein